LGSKYNGTLTGKKFLFHEMRVVARLKADGIDDDCILNKVYSENLFQYPTEREIKRLCKGCLDRINAINCNPDLIAILAGGSVGDAKQVAFYAMMKDSYLLTDFMLTVIAEKYRQQDFSLSMRDLNMFFSRLQEQNDDVAKWTESTIKKIRQVIIKCLMEVEYITSIKEGNLLRVVLNPPILKYIKENGDSWLLPAFNWFED